MATSIGQYAPVFLPGEPPSLTEKLGRLLSTGFQRVRHYQSDPVCVDPRLFLPVVVLPQWELSVKVAQLLGLQRLWWHQVCRDMDCLCCGSYSPIRDFFQASCSWWLESLFGQSFSVAPPIQALRGLPSQGSFSVVRKVRHIEGSPWLGSYSVDWHIKHLKGHPGQGFLLCSSVCQAGVWWASLSIVQLLMLACGESEATVMSPPTRHDSAVSPCFRGCQASPTGISHHNILLHIPSICLSAVNSSPRPGITPQSLNSSSQSLHLPGDLCYCLGHVWLWQGLSDSHSI